MELKRKRSESDFSTSTTSSFNSSFQSGSISPPFADTPMRIDSSISPLLHINDRKLSFPHVPGRTMKRFRDNRPSEHEVHQRTLDMLYAAQRLPTTASVHKISTAGQQQQHTPVAVQPSLSQTSHQTSLHKFWNLPLCPLTTPPTEFISSMIDAPTECDDCGQKLGGDDDNMMDLDGASESESTSCFACGKHVCSHCSISNIGEQRRCLACAHPVSTTRIGSGAGTLPLARGMSNWLC
ncbi:hypothetical protein GGS21DRAFT_502955 [Xylaria nigripes]|nr:hypothetical protein GGS21DRAFT_502955 [Xylaria nigripes]